MPFVGFINKPPNYTVSEFTKENINYCTKHVLTDVTGTAFQPIKYIASSLTALYTSLLESIQSIRIMVDSIRKNLTNITDTIFTKMINNFLSIYPNFKDTICCLPCDYFCCGSGGTVPSTKNKFIQHKFTGSWLK